MQTLVPPSEKARTIGVMWPEKSQALHDAAKKGQDQIVMQLLADEPELINCTLDHDEVTVMHHAAELGHVNVVACLLRVNPAMVDAVDSRGETALHYAARHGRGEVVAQLLEANPGVINAKARDGSIALFFAILYGHGHVVAQLLAVGPHLIGAVDKYGDTVLHFAVRGDVFTQVLDAVVATGHSNYVNAAGAHGWTVLHLAARASMSKLVAQLLALSPDLVHSVDSQGQTALVDAVFGGNVEVVAQLLAVGGPRMVHVVDHSGKTALHHAATLVSRKVMLQLLGVSSPALIKLADPKGFTALHYAVKEARELIAEALLEADGGLVNAVTHADDTALHLAVGNCSERFTVKLFQRNPKALHHVNAHGDTPFQLLSRKSLSFKKSVVEALQWPLTLDEIVGGFEANRELSEVFFREWMPALRKQCEPLLEAVNHDVARVVFEYMFAQPARIRLLLSSC